MNKETSIYGQWLLLQFHGGSERYVLIDGDHVNAYRKAMIKLNAVEIEIANRMVADLEDDMSEFMIRNVDMISELGINSDYIPLVMPLVSVSREEYAERFPEEIALIDMFGQMGGGDVIEFRDSKARFKVVSTNADQTTITLRPDYEPQFDGVICNLTLNGKPFPEFHRKDNQWRGGSKKKGGKVGYERR